MVIIAGIDEAGYGPLLGPLVVSAVSIRIDGGSNGNDLWGRFRIGRARDRGKPPAGVRVDDSKALHRGPHGFRLLEENVLPFLRCLGHPPRSFCDFLERFAPEATAPLREYPWYDGRDFSLPCSANPVRVADRAAQLARALEAGGGKFVGAEVALMNPREFNAAVAGLGTKSAALADRTAALLRRLRERWREADLDVRIDRHGGRKRYAPLLAGAFPAARLTAEVESNTLSSYTLWEGDRLMRVSFRTRADADDLIVALASMFSKYTRELFMRLLNAYWCTRVPGLKPTAGYVTDGRRFLREIAPALAQTGTDVGLMLRCR